MSTGESCLPCLQGMHGLCTENFCECDCAEAASVEASNAPEEIEVARRNLLAQLRAGYGESMEYVRLDLQTVRDLIEVLEAS